MKLPEICRWVIAAVIFASSAMSFGQTDVSLLLKSWADSTNTEAHGDVLVFPEAHLGHSDQEIEMTEADSDGRFRLSSDLPLNPTLGYDWTMLNTTGDRGMIPERLQDLSVAAATPLFRTDHGFVGLLAGVGYAGDEYFGNDSAWYGKGNLMYGRQLDKDSGLLLFVAYDGNRTLLPDVPIPGVAYANHANPDLQYTLGFPESSTTWRMFDGVKLSATWDFPDNFTANIGYKISNNLSFLLGYDNIDDAFHAANLPDNRRFFFLEQRVELKLIYSPVKDVDLTAGFGYAFARQFARGFDDRDLKRVYDIADRPYLRFGLNIRF
ncbi:MAG TPA: hypothetical protein VG722_12900 [Tepidisphaeraceae bacterium]|nr:hypothetical protein [Tepidisphaeraceae bacterium]